MGKCVKCGNALGIFSAKHKLKDGFACSACFEEIKVENTKIMKDCINKYLLNKDAGFYAAVQDIRNRSASMGLESYSLDKIKAFFHSWQGSLESNRAGFDIDTLMSCRKECENSLLFLNDLEKLAKIFQNKGIDIDYLKILSLFAECIDEGYNEAVEIEAEKVCMAISAVDHWRKNLNQDDVVRLAKQLLTKEEYSPHFISDVVIKLFTKFSFQGSKEEIKSLIEKIEEDDELSDFEENLGVHQKTCMGDFKELDGHQFEAYLKKLFEALNYTVIRTKLSGDQGADLVLSIDNEKTVVQVKKYNGDVSNKAIQEVVAAKNYYKADKALVVTNSFFTKGAIDLALANKVELWDGKKLALIIDDLNKTSDKTPEDGIRYSDEGVKLVDEGKMNGNILTPTVVIMPAILTLLQIKAKRLLPHLAVNKTIKAPKKPNTGASIVQGYKL